MANMIWSERYKVNIAEIDEQHKKLFDMVNELDSAIRAGHGQEAVGKTVVGLLSYAKNHFSVEEGYMKTNGYPEFQTHRQLHMALTEKAIGLHMQFSKKSATPEMLLEFLKNWLSNHILTEDMKYSPYLKSKGVT